MRSTRAIFQPFKTMFLITIPPKVVGFSGDPIVPTRFGYIMSKFLDVAEPRKSYID